MLAVKELAPETVRGSFKFLIYIQYIGFDLSNKPV
jgi:hypothetical protein